MKVGFFVGVLLVASFFSQLYANISGYKDNDNDKESCKRMRISIDFTPVDLSNRFQSRQSVSQPVGVYVSSGRFTSQEPVTSAIQVNGQPIANCSIVVEGQPDSCSTLPTDSQNSNTCSVVRGNQNVNCSTKNNPGIPGRCSVDDNANGQCSIMASTHGFDGRCSVRNHGDDSFDTKICSVNKRGTCSTNVVNKFCSTSNFEDISGQGVFCSVRGDSPTIPAGQCSTFSVGICSINGSASDENTKGSCSVSETSSPQRCSAFTEGTGECSAFGSGTDNRFCSVVYKAGSPAECTAFDGAAQSKCSVHSSPGANTKCSVIDASGNILPPSDGRCNASSDPNPNPGGVGSGVWWLYETRKIESYVANEGRLRPELATVAMLLIGLALTFRQKSTR